MSCQAVKWELRPPSLCSFPSAQFDFAHYPLEKHLLEKYIVLFLERYGSSGTWKRTQVSVGIMGVAVHLPEGLGRKKTHQSQRVQVHPGMGFMSYWLKELLSYSTYMHEVSAVCQAQSWGHRGEQSMLPWSSLESTGGSSKWKLKMNTSHILRSGLCGTSQGIGWEEVSERFSKEMPYKLRCKGCVRITRLRVQGNPTVERGNCISENHETRMDIKFPFMQDG